MEFEARVGRRQFIKRVSLIGAGAGVASLVWGTVDTIGQTVAIVQTLDSAARHLESRSQEANLIGHQQVGIANHLAKDESPRTKIAGGAILSAVSVFGLAVSSDRQ